MRKLLLALILLSSVALCNADIKITNVTFSPDPGMYDEVTNITVNATTLVVAFAGAGLKPYNITFYEKIGGNWSKIGQEKMNYNDLGVVLTWTAGAPGTRNFRIVADEANESDDTNRNNNEWTGNYTVKPQDLDASAFSIDPASGIAGDVSTIALRVHKSGGTASLVHGGFAGFGHGFNYVVSTSHDPYNVTFYDFKPDGSVAVIKTLRVNYQEPDSDMDFAVNWTPLLPGKHRIRAAVDVANEYNESDESNNNVSLDYNVDAAETLLAVDCGTLQADSYGFVDLAAYAGFYRNGALYCYDTNVTAAIGSYRHELAKYYSCRFSKAVQLPVGTYTVSFRADYKGTIQPKQKNCTISVQSSLQPNLVTYGLQDNAAYRRNESVHVEAVATSGGQNILGGEAVAALMSGSRVVTGIFLERDSRGVFKGDLVMDASEGNYTLLVGYSYEFWYAQKEFAIRISNAAAPAGQAGAPGMRLTVLYPKDNTTYTMNSTLPIQVRVEDLNSLIVPGATVTARVWQEGVNVENVTLGEARYYYEKQYLFTEGLYLLNISASKAGIGAASNVIVQFIAGQRPVAKTANLTVSIISTKSDVYAENSTLVVRARVTNNTDSVKDATVIMLFEGAETNLTYDRYGEYTGMVGPLPEGEYDLTVIASLGDQVAQDRVAFMTSRHRLDVRPVAPEYQQVIELKKGQSTPVAASVTDETGDVVSGALVVAEILEPTGRALEMQVFQTPATGQYDTIFYPNDDGIYKITFKASKERFVGDSEDSEFTVKMKKEDILPVKISFETLLTIVLLLAIIILLAAILKIIF